MWPRSAHLQAETFARDALVRSIWGNPPVFAHESFPWNEPAFHRAEIPAVNGIGTARSVARLYGALDDLVSPDTLGLARTALSEGDDIVLAAPVRFGLGFQLRSGSTRFGPAPEAFGHDGAGGSVHGAWPEQRIGFSYAMNRLRDDLDPDPRPKALLDALWAAYSA